MTKKPDPRHGQPVLTEAAKIERDKGNLVEVTISETRRSRLPWRRRVVTGRREFLMTRGEALHAAEVLEARGAEQAAENLRSVVLAHIRNETLSDLDDVIKRLRVREK